jgi:hypothetical protein
MGSRVNRHKQQRLRPAVCLLTVVVRNASSHEAANGWGESNTKSAERHRNCIRIRWGRFACRGARSTQGLTENRGKPMTTTAGRSDLIPAQVEPLKNPVFRRYHDCE